MDKHSPDRSRRAVYLVHASVNKKPSWYYIETDALKAPLLKRAIATGQGEDLTRFGVILESGWGETPPPDIQAKFDPEHR